MSSIKIFDPKDFPDYLPKLNSLYDDLFSGGKGFRSKLIGWVGQPLGLKEAELALLSQTIEFIHNASLLHDDLIDRSQLRRGKTAAWLKYTPEYAVLAGDYLLARVMVNLSSYGNIELVKFTSQTISDLLEGEWIQDSLVGDFDLSLDQLDQVHELKTASLFKWCIIAPVMTKGLKDPEVYSLLDQMGSLLGKCFQRSDDLLDFDVRNDEKKAPLGDLKSGYFNSFATFLTSDLQSSRRELFAKVKTLDEAKEFLGQDIFNAKLMSFDEINKGLVQLYDHYLGEVERRLSPDFADLIKNMKPLAHLLYWRTH